MKRSPVKSARAYCLWCCGGQSNEVKLCPDKEGCVLWPYRFGRGRITLRIIRKKCLNCDGEGIKSIRNCVFNGVDDEFCPLYPYRLGHRPLRDGARGTSPTNPAIRPGFVRVTQDKGDQK